MECHYCGSTACKAAVTDDRNDCLHCSDQAIEEEAGVLAYENGEKLSPNASKEFKKGWLDAASHYGDQQRIIPDGAHHSGLMKDYGGMYNPNYKRCLSASGEQHPAPSL